MSITSRKAALSGLARRRGCAARRLRHSTGGSASKRADSRRQRLPALHGLRRRRLRRQVVQPARARGSDHRGERARRRGRARPVRCRHRLRAEHHQLVDQNCNLIVTVGFDLAAASRRRRQGQPRRRVRHHRRRRRRDRCQGHRRQGHRRRKPDYPNIKPILFDTAQAAFLAGYARRATRRPASSAPSVACPSRRSPIFMDGFVEGVNYYNTRRTRTSRSSAGTCRPGRLLHRWLRRRQKRSNAPGPDRPERRRHPARSAVRSTRAPPRPSSDSGKDIALIGVDADVFETDPTVPGPPAHLDPEGHRRRRVEAVVKAAAAKRVRQHAVHRHPGERRSRPRAVPRLRGQGRPRPAG